MTGNPTVFTFASPTHLILEVPENVQNQIWQENTSFSHQTSRYQAYINKICLFAILPWLQEDLASQAKPWLGSAALPSFWEFVNGTAIAIGETRLILVPSEEMDMSELRVPQEWVDIPSWAGDYYLAVQVEPDDEYVKVWGYCTHEQLKNKGSYDAGDRTYSLEATDIIEDISTLAVAYQLCPPEVTRSSIQPLPTLLQEQAQNLISRLEKSEIVSPRMEIPFQLWGGLMEHGGWRKSLYQRRLGIQEEWSLLAWLENGVSQLAEAIGWERFNLQHSAAGARSTEEKIQLDTFFSRQLPIAGQSYELRILPKQQEEVIIWRFELRNAVEELAIPGGFTLRLLTEDLQPFPNNEDVATTTVKQLFVEVALEPQEGIVWEITPFPENYEREILRF
ncbi:hypothetical protein WA1_29010 [Scytonema hofmannii PCC 7110]|uniref:DUF1822 domain-containing protein n=1 Tax=Scytonema hofmannii PCC 7110 TaxID=128403 RepID=A0A139X5N5_9CYAN|nr:DUF1822 family protein [Scytonema hofmannii]KYC40000.1 hypothetical protein WA1_29010 [Scytonema hofmannii PCC 7110]